MIEFTGKNNHPVMVNPELVCVVEVNEKGGSYIFFSGFNVSVQEDYDSVRRRLQK